MWTGICSNRATKKEKKKKMNVEELNKIKIDMKCSDIVKELESRGHVVCTYNDNGEEYIQITDEGIKWFNMMTKVLKTKD